MRDGKRHWASIACSLLLVLPLACTSGGEDPRIQVLAKSVDYGKIPVGQIVKHRFDLKNAGGAPLKITNTLLPGGTIQTKALEGC